MNNYIKSIPKDSKFNYLVVSIGSIAFMYYILKPSWTIIIGIIFAIVMVYFLNDRRISEISDYNTELKYRLNSLPQNDYFYVDPDIINIFYNTKDFLKYNKDAYLKCVKATDNFLKIFIDITEKGVEDPVSNLEVAEDQYLMAINNFQSFIVTIPPQDIIRKKYQESLNALQLTLRRHIDTMAEIAKYKGDRININNRFYNNKYPKGVVHKEQELDYF